MPVKYERVDRELVHEIFTTHILKGEPLLDHVLDGPIEQARRSTSSSSAAVPAAAGGGEKLCRRARCPRSSARRASGRTGCGSPRPVASGPAARSRPARCTHLLVRPDKVLYRVAERGRPRRDHPRARPRRAGRRAAEGPRGAGEPGVLRALRRRGLLQPPEPHRPAAQRRDRSRRASRSTSTTAASRPWPRCWSRATRSGSSTR